MQVHFVDNTRMYTKILNPKVSIPRDLDLTNSVLASFMNLSICF